MINKVIFITTYPDARILKRVNEFIDNGFKISLYTFIRENISYPRSSEFEINKLNSISLSYCKRVFDIVDGILKIKNKYKKENDCLYYYFGLDVALIGSLLIKNKYIYEESDLVQTYLKNPFIENLLNLFDKQIIKKSLETVLTSEGFLLYHYKNQIPKNITIIPNKLNKKILTLQKIDKSLPDLKKIKIGFVGFIRYNSVLNFAECFATSFPNYEFHFFGIIINQNINISFLQKLPNIYFHGEFNSPEDLPKIYSSIDLVLSTYDADNENVKYAEPNKLYEAIYFHTPIIVSKNTFLSQKIQELGIGYSINAMNNNEIIEFINDLNIDDLNNKISNCKKIPITAIIDDCSSLFKKLNI